MNQLHHNTGRFAVLALLSLGIADTAVVAHSDLSDEKMERFLLEADIMRIDKIIDSSTYPMALKLKLNGEVRRAAFKYGDTLSKGEDPCLDSYRHEVAAYRLDRALGLNMVPVAVIREIKTEGVVIEWIADAFNQQERREQGFDPPDPQRLIEQQARMNLFDALTLNETRGETDQLIESESWDLRLIDHSRAFGESDWLPPSFLSRPASVPRSLLRNLEELDGESLEELLGQFLCTAQIRALLERRDKILEKIDADRKQYGDATVFQD